MRIRKFKGATMREAISQVKRELGPDAIVLATRNTRTGLLGTGVEITAAVDGDENSDLPAASYGPRPAPRAASPAVETEQLVAPLRAELRSLRASMRTEKPTSPDVRKDLQEVKRQLLRLLESKQEGDQPSLGELTRTHTIAAASGQRILALVGPTGVGKTTTIAKLAARAALVERRRVAIVSLDTYRVAGVEQIRTFADLIRVPLRIASDAQRLSKIVESLGNAQRIYIDTTGRSPKEASAMSELESALQRLPNIEVHMVLPANSQASVIDTTYRRYRPLNIDRILFTKVDEADDLEQLVRAPARLGTSISYLTTGQRVPEDLEDATPDRLLELAAGGYPYKEIAA